MKPTLPVLTGVLAALATGAAQASPDLSAEIVKDFSTTCAVGDPSQNAVIARADAAGWRRGGPDAPQGPEPRTDRLRTVGADPIILHAETSVTLGERQDVCGVSTRAPAPRLLEAVEAWIGFAPSVPFGQSATFFAVRTGDVWRSGALLDHAAFLNAKSEGRFYSLAVMNTGHAASLILERATPGANAKP